mmetsp:Transcript_54465/g.117914  ORF Transcript_54465/g.117914 Transcript_54465/m.117914 type:complete len:304 (+) Transcript_54465:41-952(+)|eukprot:CAMPEP_0170595508 /NCGR_PEP_ID=MMETSP0224-20130122/14603_1 /TAXON_ID=285029 /ORGANISM="Togula jolla, Strain CCCM 725" /LENGTH=303 /DNA_ID=CAMNT_0010919701 /DNA_START=37 /DNA_END=948 /DNA_ORIENTATION=-
MALVTSDQRESIEKVIAGRRVRFRFMRHDSWENVLFVHWPVDPLVVAERLPRGLEPDLLDGKAWIGLVLLTERGVSAHASMLRRIVAPIDHIGANVRTYVRHNGIPGIFFWSLECSSVVASMGARLAGIPYFPARMWRSVDIASPLGLENGVKGCFEKSEPPMPCESNGTDAEVKEGKDFVFRFSSVRAGFRREPAFVTARWRCCPKAENGEAGFEEKAQWFCERYSVYAAWPAGRGPLLLRGDVQHRPWPIQAASLVDLKAGSLLAAAGLPDPAGGGPGGPNPHVCFSRGVGPIEFWIPEPV